MEIVIFILLDLHNAELFIPRCLFTGSQILGKVFPCCLGGAFCIVQIKLDARTAHKFGVERGAVLPAAFRARGDKPGAFRQWLTLTLFIVVPTNELCPLVSSRGRTQSIAGFGIQGFTFPIHSAIAYRLIANCYFAFLCPYCIQHNIFTRHFKRIVLPAFLVFRLYGT